MSAAAAGPARGSAVAALPWDDLFRTAVLRLRLRPDDVWRMTLKEIWMLLAPAGETDTARMSRVRLAGLMERFPDG